MGRRTCTVAEVEAQFVPSDPSDVRRVIWDQWVDLTNALRSIVGEVAACWLSGSFFTDKPIPGDIDCLYVIDTSRLAAVSASGQVNHIWFLHCASRGRVKSAFGLNVDSYVLEWAPTPGPARGVGTGTYLADRGYWDDLWVRVKDPDARLDSIPRRGYLEVILDGYK